MIFTDTSGGLIDGWRWDFGDGFTSTVQSPSHTYTAAGAYTVCLVVRGPAGTDTEERREFVSVQERRPSLVAVPNRFLAMVGTGHALTQTMLISNTGEAGGSVSFVITETVSVSWLGLEPSSGVVAPGVSVPITLLFDASGLVTGSYTSSLRIGSQLPYDPGVSVPVTMAVGKFLTLSNIVTTAFPRISAFVVVSTEVGRSGTLTTTHFSLSEDGVSQAIDSVTHAEGPAGRYLIQYATTNPTPDGLQRSVVVTWHDPAEAGVDSDEGRYHSPSPPHIILSADALSATVGSGSVVTRSIVVSNAGGWPLSYTTDVGDYAYPGIAMEQPVVLGSGGPDAFGYRWSDSDALGGPAYEWIEITPTGNAVGIWGDDDAATIPIGFGFEFYGTVYTQVEVSTNGFVTFDLENRPSPSNVAIPRTDKPNNLVAAFWDNLHAPSVNSVFCQTQGTAPKRRFVVEWHQVERYGAPASSYTFEIVLEETTGSILIQYQRMSGVVTSATVGIENAAGSDGLQVVHDSPYIRDSLAVRFARRPPWLRLDPASGVVSASASVPLRAVLEPATLLTGTYLSTIYLSTNDPDTPDLVIPVSITVLGGGGVIGWVDLQGRSDNRGAVVSLNNFYTAAVLTDGSFRIPNVVTGTYVVSASIAGYLSARMPELYVAGAATTVLPSVKLLGGNAVEVPTIDVPVPTENAIDIYDLAVVGANFGLPVPPADARADINGDGLVNIFDSVLVGANYGLTGPRPWPSP